MNKNRAFLIAVSTIVALTLAPSAYAGSPWRNVVRGLQNNRSGVRSAPLRNVGRNVARSGVRAPIRSGSTALNRSRSPIPGRSIQDMARGLPQSGRARASSGNRAPLDGRDMLDLFRGVSPHGYGGHHSGGYYRERDEMARAYRDVGMVNAFVGLAGILISASQHANDGAVAPVHAYTAVAPAPAPLPGLVAHAPAPPPPAATPSGRWERQAVVLQPQSREEHQQWVPETFDPHTGARTGGGYYEIRTRVTPEVVQYHDVWVGP